ncbi:MAG: LuxR C-terminal-related transcriptional regulator [bacterium]
MTESSLFQFITTMPNPAHVKDASNGKYIMTNKNNLRTFDFICEDELLGLTLDEIDSVFMRQHWGMEFAKEVAMLDAEVKSIGNLVVGKNKIFKDRQGIIRFQNMHKSPFFCGDKKEKVSAILTITYEYTDKIDLITLYNNYKEVYKSKTEALYCFSRYIDIVNFFYEPLTEKELFCLLYAKLNQGHKNIAKNLNITVKTVETHLMNMANKLKNHSMQDVIGFLRNKK